MPSISSGNNSGLYDIDSVNIPIDDNITANNITATGNVTVGGYIIANGSITTNSNFVGNLVGNLIGNISLAGSNTQVIFNDSGVTGGSNAFTFNKATNAAAITGTLSATGNITGDYILGNGSQLTGLPATYSNANVVSLMANFGSNTISTSGNITGGYILGNGSQLTGLPQQYGNANVAAYLASGTNTQNIVTSGTVQGNILQTAGAGGNITGVNYISANYFVGDGSFLTNVSGNLAGNMQGNILGNGFGISNIAFLSVTGASTLANVAITGGANIDVGNNRITNVATPSSGTDAATKDYVDSVASSGFTIEDSAANTTTVAGGDTLELLGTANQVSVAITANDQVTFSLPSAISVAGNITGGNITTAGSVSATGNVTANNMSVSTSGTLTVGSATLSTGIGMPSILGITASLVEVENLDSQGNINGVTISATGNVNAGNSSITNDLTVGGTIYGTFSGNIAGNLVVPGANTQIIFNNAGNAGASSDFTFDDGTNVMTLNGLANVTGNVQGGNITTVGLMSAAGNITANTALKTPKWTISGNIITSPNGGTWYSDEVNLDEFISSRNDGYIDLNAKYANGERGSEIHLEHGLLHLSTNPVVDPRYWYFYGNGLMTAAGDITTSGNITANYYFGNGSQLTGLPATYSNANVATFLANFGSNTISTSGNITSGNIIANGQFLTNLPAANVTGTVANATYALSANTATYANIVLDSAQPNITSVGTLTSLSVTGNTTSGNLITGGLLTVTGNITGGNISTTGVFTASNTAANLQVANIIFNNQQLQTVAARNPGAISATVADPGRIVIGTGYSGNLSPGNDINNTGRGTRLLVSDNLTMGDTQQRTLGLGVQQYVAATANITNANTRAIGTSTQLMVGGGASGNTWGGTLPITISASTAGLTIGGGTSGNLTAVGNTTVTAAAASFSSMTISAGSSLRNGFTHLGLMLPAANIGNAIGYATQFGGSTGYTGNAYAIYHPGSTNDFGFVSANIARAATNYYFLRNDDNVAQTKLGSMRLSHEYRYDTATTGSITIDKNNGQTQYIALTGNVTIAGFSNFVVSASDGTTTDYQFDTVTLVFRNDSTGRTITMPTGATYKYAGGVSTLGTTANAVQMASVTAWDDSGTTRYLITLSPEFT